MIKGPEAKMFNYLVTFYKTLLNSEGHEQSCVQRKIDVCSDSPSGALVLAEQQLGRKLPDFDRVEVKHVSLPNHPGSGVSSNALVEHSA